jgi:hypothetical protein
MWGNLWPIIEKEIIGKLQDELSNTYIRQRNKINTLKKNTMNSVTKQKTNTQAFPFFHRIKNLSNITFSNEEYNLLSKGLQYNLGQKRKNKLQTLALEAETAISHLHISK